MSSAKRHRSYSPRYVLGPQSRARRKLVDRGRISRPEFYNNEKESKLARSRSLLLVIRWILNLRIRRDGPRWGRDPSSIACKLHASGRKKKLGRENGGFGRETFPFLSLTLIAALMQRHSSILALHLTRQPLFTRAVVHRVYDDRHLCGTHPDEHLFSFDKNAVIQILNRINN